MDIFTNVMGILAKSPKGITRRELTFTAFGTWTPDHDRAVRKALQHGRRAGLIIVSVPVMGQNRYVLIDEKTDPEILKLSAEYIARQQAAAKTALWEMGQIFNRIAGLRQDKLL